MPPRPAPSSARHGSSQRRESDEERAVKLLEPLAATADLGAFVVQKGELDWLQWLASSSNLSTAMAAAAGSTGHALLAAWVAAAARSMQLAAEQLVDARSLIRHNKAITLLRVLLCGISYRCFILLEPELESHRVRVALSVLAARAGLVKAHEQLSLRLASIISNQQAASRGAAATQQKQMVAQEALACLAELHLDLFARMGRAWPGGASALFGPSICQAVPAAAGLAAAVLRSKEAQSAWSESYETVRLLGDAYSSEGSSVPAQIAGSSNIATLLLMWLGLAAERVHQLQHGLSPATVGAAPSAGVADAQQPQQLAVPAHHSQLLQALGVVAGGTHPESPLAAKTLDFSRQVLRALIKTRGHQQHLADAAAAALCQQSLLLVLLECSLLHPAAPLVEGVATTLQTTLAGSGEAVWQLGPTLLRAVLEQDACRHGLEAAAPAAPAAATSDGADNRHLNVLDVLATLALEINKDMLGRALVDDHDGDKTVFDRLLADVMAMWQEHTAHYASLLEAGLRLLPSNGDALALAACAASAVLIAKRGAGSGPVAADSQQQVFALLLSCLKAATVAAGKGSSSSSSDDAVAREDAEQIWGMASCVVNGAIRYTCGWLFFPSSIPSTSSPSSGGPSNQTSMAASAAAADDGAGIAAQLGCVLLARCLVAAGRLLQQAPQAPATNSNTSMQHLLVKLKLLLQVCPTGAAALFQQLPQAATVADADEPWLQQLLAERALLQQQLEILQAQMAAASGAAGNPVSVLQPLPAAALAGVAERLQSFGAAACAALPVQLCCNHPDCSNLQRASELDLVGGKSCVCGGCRVARYCSRECQVAHYKGWHKPLCKRLQAQKQQEAGQQQQQQQQPAA